MIWEQNPQEAEMPVVGRDGVELIYPGTGVSRAASVFVRLFVYPRRLRVGGSLPPLRSPEEQTHGHRGLVGRDPHRRRRDGQRLLSDDVARRRPARRRRPRVARGGESGNAAAKRDAAGRNTPET